MTTTSRKITSKSPADDEEPAAAEVPAAPEPEVIPEPTQTKAVWFPAIVQLPGKDVLLREAKVYACVEGLYVFANRPESASMEPTFFAEVDYPNVPKPPTGWQARNGFTIPTSKGDITITMGSGCGCSSPLKKWSPEFGKRVVVW